MGEMQCTHMAGQLGVTDPPSHSFCSDVETRDKGGGLRTAVAPALLLVLFRINRDSPVVHSLAFSLQSVLYAKLFRDRVDLLKSRSFLAESHDALTLA